MLLYCDDISSMTDEQFNLFLGIMPEERRKKAARYVKTQDKYLCAVSFALLSYALNLNGYKIGEYVLLKSENGKPYLKNLPLHFNLSHTSDAVACVVSQTETGVDIQKKTAEFNRVMRRVCSENEADLICDSENPADTFTKLWTLKESYVKCIGTGIYGNMREYDFTSIAQKGYGKLYGYDFSAFDLGEYVLSVCSSTPVEKIEKISLEELEFFWGNV